ncbi:MAG: hypothetical protein U1F67_24615 [Rubrivivax sp.]
MEGEHMEALARRYGIDVPDPPLASLRTAVVFAGIDRLIGDPSDLLRIAIGFEQRAAATFAASAAAAAPGSAEQRLYEELTAEEREHERMLDAELSRWHARGAERAGESRRRCCDGAAQRRRAAARRPRRRNDGHRVRASA